jgi:pyoverdine/dityrosine biosynthesis protein Dit1
MLDLLGVPDETVWDFGQAVRAMADQHGLTHLSFLRLWDLLGNKGDFADKSYYLSHSDAIRAELLDRFGDKAFEADMAGKSTQDMQLTHTKYLEFLEQDLRFDARHLKLDDEAKKSNIAETAKAMMFRWKAFSTALAAGIVVCVWGGMAGLSSIRGRRWIRRSGRLWRGRGGRIFGERRGVVERSRRRLGL